MKTFPLQYGLKLEDGVFWNLNFSPDLITWGREFGKILGLKEDTQNHQHQMFFYSGEEEYLQSHIYGDFLNRGSNKCKLASYFFPGLQIRYHSSSGIYHCILPEMNKENPKMRFVSMISALFPIYREAMNSGGLVLHAALLYHPNIDGIAILAPSGTGKSTCAWRIPQPWSAYCDDLILVVRKPPSKYYVHPLPTWSNFYSSRSSAPIWPIEQYTDLHGLFFLQKAENDKVIPLPKPDSVQWIYESSMQIYKEFIYCMSKEEQLNQKNIIFSNACQLARECQSFILKSTFHGCFWVEIERIFEMNNVYPLSEIQG